MIDLTKPQILTEPVKCWVKDYEDDNWVTRWLVGIDDKKQYWCVSDTDHNKVPTITDMLYNGYAWEDCTLTDPYAKNKRQMTHAEVFKAIREGAVVRSHIEKGFYGHPFNNWIASNKIYAYQICYNYTGADTDVWQSMEEEE